MDLTPPSRQSEARLRAKSASKSASRLLQSSNEFDENHPINITFPPSMKPSPIHLSPQNSLPLQELLLFSPSPRRRSKPRLLKRIDCGDEPLDQAAVGRKSRSRSHSSSLAGCLSPKNGRRARRRLEHECREEKDLGIGDDIGKVRRRRRQSRQLVSHRDKLSLSSIPTSSPSPKSFDEDLSSIQNFQETIWELIMWKDVAKSSLWFGIGCLCFSSSYFSRGVGFSIVSSISQLGLLLLATAFFFNSFSQRNKDDKIREFKLTEEDIVQTVRLILPAVNAAIALTRGLFSGEPSMTLKIAPIFLVASEYGHLLTLRRFLATGFIVSFTVPKLYSCYSCEMHKRVACLLYRLSDAWEVCSYKRFTVASAALAFWNLSNVRTRIFAAFIFVVVLRYYRQKSGAVREEEEREQQLALVVAEESARKI